MYVPEKTGFGVFSLNLSRLALLKRLAVFLSGFLQPAEISNSKQLPNLNFQFKKTVKISGLPEPKGCYIALNLLIQSYLKVKIYR